MTAEKAADLLLETVMIRPIPNRRSAQGVVRTVVVSSIGLLPMGIVSGLMLMQILGVWSY
jgi:hypothetical protein